MRNIFQLISLCVIASAATAQPSIDSMLVVPEASRLEVFGSFASAPGQVLIDDVEIPILSWSNSRVTCAIPDTGRGCAGPVEIIDSEGKSEPRNISLFEIYWGHDHAEAHSRFSYANERVFLRLRLDIHSQLLYKQKVSRHSVDTLTKLYISTSSTSQWSSEFGYETEYNTRGDFRARHDSGYTSGFTGNALLNLATRTISMWASDIRGVTYSVAGSDGSKLTTGSIDLLTIDLNLDSTLQPLVFDSGFISHSGTYHDDYRQHGRLSFSPPQDLIALSYHPILKNAVESAGDQVFLEWESVPNFTNYIIELAQDPTFSTAEVPYHSTGKTFVAPVQRGVLYYRRVSGENFYGVSEWSNTGSFKLEPVGSVKRNDQSITFSNGKIRYNVDHCQLKVIDMLGRTLVEKELSGVSEYRIDSYTLPLVLVVTGTLNQTLVVPRW